MVLADFAAAHCKYLVYGREVSSTGTPHLQGFMTLNKRHTLSSLKKLLGPRPHLEPARKTSEQAADYCKKDGDYEEFGTPPTPGQRTDLLRACDMIKSGHSIQAVAEECPDTFVKFGRGIRDLKLTLEKPYDHDDVRGVWYWGPPGSGKSYRARMENPCSYLKAQNKWFDGYAGEESIILDDLDHNALGHHLKIWADRYACTGETKGGTIHLRHKRFIVTSNYTPSQLFEDTEMSSAIERRFKVEYMDKPPVFSIPESPNGS
jgi:hypothetical protein